MVADCPMLYAETVWRERGDGTEQAIRLEFGYRQVRLPGFTRPLWLLVVKGFGEEPLMILTTVALRKNRAVLWWVIEAYLTRWRIEETLRFAKQSYALEDVRVLGYQSLKNMMALALWPMYLRWSIWASRPSWRFRPTTRSRRPNGSSAFPISVIMPSPTASRRS
ncbi:MAG: transposase [bacterium]|nr:transposase [bacterium]